MLTNKNNKRRGTILAVTFFLCTIMALAALWAGRTLLDHQHTNIRRRDITRAYYAAEGGVAQVIHWGNFPGEYDSTDETGLFYRDPDSGGFPNLTLALQTTPEYAIPEEKLGSFTSKHDYFVSRIKSITLIAPDPTNDPVPSLFKVRSEGATPSGSERRVLAYIRANPLATDVVKIPAAILSMASAGLSGNARVHWGEAWTKNNLQMIARSQANHLNSNSPDYDPWVKYRSEARIEFPPTWKSGEGKDIFGEDTRMYPGAAPASGDYAAALEQFLPQGTLDWPDFLSLYDTFKAQAQAHGRYYSTDAAGNIYKDGIEDPDHKVDFTTEFEKADRASAPYDLVFIDTIDGNFPASDGSNLATISVAGSSSGLKGVFWIGANFAQTGVGSPPTLIGAEKPDETTEDLSKIYLDGILYAAGTISMGGNAGVFGAIIAEMGYVGGGTPDIYYNHKLENGLEIPRGNIGSVFSIALQKNF